MVLIADVLISGFLLQMVVGEDNVYFSDEVFCVDFSSCF